jgi:anaerobic glycerol-3-phosphate dehydrogenase
MITPPASQSPAALAAQQQNSTDADSFATAAANQTSQTMQNVLNQNAVNIKADAANAVMATGSKFHYPQ